LKRRSAPLPHEPVEVLIKLNAQELIVEVADRGRHYAGLARADI
jgi:hypothetical protein